MAGTRSWLRVGLSGLAALALVGAAGGAALAGRVHRQAAEPVFLVANWQDYGSDEPWAVKYFEQKYHCIVKHVYFNSEEQALNLLRTGGIGKIDVVLPNLAYVQPAAQEGLIQPIDVAKIPNYRQIYPILRRLPYDRWNGKVYGVPWMWGTTGLAYNPQLVHGHPDSWAALWDPAYKGRIGFFNDPTTAVMTAALYLHENPYHPNLAKVEAALVRQKALDRLYWTSMDDWQHAYSSHAIILGNLWSGLAGTDIASGWPIRYVIPKEGAVGWVDNWAIVKDAPHLQLAYDWINYMISLQFQVHYAHDLSAEPPAPSNAGVNAHLSARIRQIIGSNPQWLPHLVLQHAIPAAELNRWTNLWQLVQSQ